MEGSFGSLPVSIPPARRAPGAVVIGLALLFIGLLAGLLGWWLLRRHGAAWRIGRLLAAAPQRTLAEAATLASAGTEAYVRLHGRIDSDEEFPGDDGKPLVYRRRRLQQRTPRGDWQTFDDERLAVAFRLRDKGQAVQIEADALGDGLVVVPRQSEGIFADVSEEAVSGSLPDLPPTTPVRLRIEQVSSIDHATAAGVPREGAQGTVVLGPGLGRPLLLTTLEQDEAMRVLVGGERRQLLIASGLLVAAPVIMVAGLIALLLGS
ncbi:MAG: hypothetical protein PVG27_00795 [Chloroflexota bacterium]